MYPQINIDYAASICAFLAVVFLGAWPLFRSRHTMLLMQLAALVSLSLHYTLVDARTAASVNLLGAVQIVACLLFGARPRLRWIGYALACLMLGASVITWQETISVLSTIGMVLVAVGRAQPNASAMRLLVLSGSPFWLAHDLLIMSPIAIADAASLLVGLWTLMGRRATNSVSL
jgi:uncharacterized membrane protein YkgB